MNDLIIVKLNKCKALLAECHSPGDAKKIADLAEAARVYAKRVNAGIEVVNKAAEYKIRAERRLGEILQGTERNKGGRPEITGSTEELVIDELPTLNDIGITKKLSSRAQRVAGIPEEIFEDKLKEVKKEGRELNTTTFLNLAYREIKHSDLQDIPLPTNKYRVIYADPPWQYSNSGPIGDTDHYGRIERHYSSMSIKELCDMPIKELIDDNAVLFLWVTSPMLEECFDIIKAWGFKYKTSFIWDKIKHNFGHYNSVRHEFLLVATRGSCTPDSRELHDSVVSIEKSNKHSEKPAYFREMIEHMYKGKRIELFARGEIIGSAWDIWGNESGRTER